MIKTMATECKVGPTIHKQGWIYIILSHCVFAILLVWFCDPGAPLGLILGPSMRNSKLFGYILEIWFSFPQ